MSDDEDFLGDSDAGPGEDGDLGVIGGEDAPCAVVGRGAGRRLRDAVLSGRGGGAVTRPMGGVLARMHRRRLGGDDSGAGSDSGASGRPQRRTLGTRRRAAQPAELPAAPVRSRFFPPAAEGGAPAAAKPFVPPRRLGLAGWAAGV